MMEADRRKNSSESHCETTNIGIVVIGRNEGERLARSLRSIGTGPAVIYVDSGSTDGSLDTARAMEIETVALSRERGFTAARARNAGMRRLDDIAPETALFQMIDGDCELREGWLKIAAATMAADPGLAAVFGRRRERFAAATVYNRLCDVEWAIPPGPADAFGGDVMLRRSAIRQVGAYDETMIAGEDPDLSIRLRKAGWRIACIDAEMTLHDAAMTRLAQWWRRTERAGHAFAELAARHPEGEAQAYRASCRRIMLWGGAIPAAALTALAIGLAIASNATLAIAAFALLLPFAQIARLCLREARRRPRREALALAFFLTIGKYAEIAGMTRYHWNRLRGRRSVLIEYKGA